MKVVPLGDKVVVKRLENGEKTPAGIVLPESVHEGSLQGRVLSVGDGKLLTDGSRAEHEVSEGDRILFSNDSGTEVIVDGEHLLIMGEEEILAVVH